MEDVFNIEHDEEGTNAENVDERTEEGMSVCWEEHFYIDDHHDQGVDESASHPNSAWLSVSVVGARRTFEGENCQVAEAGRLEETVTDPSPKLELAKTQI